MAQNGGYMITLVTTTLESEPVWNIEAPGLRLLCHQSKLSLQSSISLTNPACPWTFLSLISNLRLEITDIEYKEHTEYFRLQDWAFLWLAKPCTQMILSHLLKHSLDKWYGIHPSIARFDIIVLVLFLDQKHQTLTLAIAPIMCWTSLYPFSSACLCPG